MGEHGAAGPDRPSSAAEAVVERLYRESSRQLLVAAYALTGDLAEAEDAVQEAFVRAFARPSAVARADNPVAWMRIVTLNIARSRFRRRQRLNVLLRRLPPAPVEVPAAEPDRLFLTQVVRGLPRPQREVITLFYLADLSLEDVAQTLKVSVNVVKSRLHRGRRALAKTLREHGIDLEPHLAEPVELPVPAVAGAAKGIGR
ncbi:RNA polymerase sigma factor [Fodinicola feengrottensis]|uniref:SigE family RNA polymerase sigma factor n=1 Tax=Fodinicola feengrottensis TaxID=435914 RepID=A0ABN2G3W3_9ACTN|nr:sigma-70 family RNA polymerase sigma factor [Fodinicola feengrottensis]